MNSYSKIVGALLVCACVLSMRAGEAQDPGTSSAPANPVAAEEKPGRSLKKVLPENCPVPTYPENVISATALHSNKHSTMGAGATLVTKDPADVVFKWYADYFRDAKWQVQTSVVNAKENDKKKDDMRVLTAGNGQQLVTIYCLTNKSMIVTTLNISWSAMHVKARR